eukprot:TRINITY_DN19672_c0_g1_i1.p1 TRINITY_DN19672_c0_g1~~TRINITY_DN19672_c0_g1_i1.p1  ORF type:complete len:679 (-),score=140.55 TRINITY_DN19672_c0_g1_i1:107-2143(-)
MLKKSEPKTKTRLGAETRNTPIASILKAAVERQVSKDSKGSRTDSAAFDHDDDTCEYYNDAEEAAVEVVDAILTKGANTLQKKWRHTRSLQLASQNACEAACSQLDMCFVPNGGSPIQEDGWDDWDLEGEPEPEGIDSWGRSCIEVKRESPRKAVKRKTKPLPQNGSDMTQPSGNLPNNEFKLPGAVNLRLIHRDRQTSLLQDKRTNLDPAEESSRRLWAERAAARALEQEQAAAVHEKAAREEERRRQEVAEALAENPEDQDQRRFAYDSEGRLMYFDQPALEVEKLPKTDNLMQFSVHTVKGLKVAGIEELWWSSDYKNQQSVEEPQAHHLHQPDSRSRSKKKGMSKTRAAALKEEKFSDGFRKLENQQPPVMETMSMQHGVVLECQGRKKAGPKLQGEATRMAWREYLNMVQAQDEQGSSTSSQALQDTFSVKTLGSAIDFSVKTPGSTRSMQATATAPGSLRSTMQKSAPTPAGTPAVTIPMPLGTPSDSAQASQTLPSSAQATGHSETSNLSTASSTSATAKAAAIAAATAAAACCASTWGPGVRAPPVRPVSAHSGPLAASAPAAPPPGLLASRAAAEAVASFTVLRSQPRQPRQKVVMIGGIGLGGSVQPPLGATMGHGLMASVKKGEVFCPRQPKGDRSCRSQSMGSLSRPRSASFVEGRRSATPSRAWR